MPDPNAIHNQELLVTQLATGMFSIADLARSHGMSAAAIKATAERLAAEVDAKRTYLDSQAVMAIVKMNELLQPALSSIGGAIQDREHKDNVSTSKWLVERVIPAKQVVNNNVQIGMTPELANALLPMLQGLNAAKATVVNGHTVTDPHVYHGAEALALPDAPTTTPVDAGPDDSRSDGADR